MPDLTDLQFAALAVILFIAVMCALGYAATWVEPQYEEEPEIPKKSGYLAEIEMIAEERL